MHGSSHLFAQAWLDPLNLPTREQLTCPHTGQTMHFLLQVYAPVEHNDDAFHRTLFLFVSPQVSAVCVEGVCGCVGGVAAHLSCALNLAQTML